MTSIAFVAPFLAPATLRFARAAAALDGVRCGIITQSPADAVPADLRARLDGHWQVKNGLDAKQIAEAARGLSGIIGPVERLIAILEPLQEPLAEACAILGLPGLSVEASHNFRDKARMKTVLAQNGVPCARHRLVTSPEAALTFSREIGYPLIVKPPAGAGAISTFRVENEHDLREGLAMTRASQEKPMLLEEFLAGEEYSFDSVMINGRVVWHSFSRYYPTPLEVLENPWVQWCVLLPHDITGSPYREALPACTRALDVLGMRSGMSHMEWFRRKSDGSVAISEVGARPPGAQFTSLLSYAHDIDMYGAWAKLMALDHFDPPPRKYAVGAAYFRGQGSGHRVVKVHGLDEAQRELGELVIEASVPKPGQKKADTYEGDGYAILRHPDTDVVERGLHRLVSLVRVETKEG